MARSTGSGAVEAIQRQVRRVRWRRNLRDLQRALYLLIAVGTGGATALVLLALTASPRLFARAVAAIAGATLGAALVIVRDVRRRWIPGDRAALWIDHRGGLTGRLATLVELRRREEAEPPLLALLVEQNVARLALWRPDRLVPRRVPRAALAAAAGGVTLLALVVALAPRLRPPAPELVAGEGSARPRARRPGPSRARTHARRRPPTPPVTAPSSRHHRPPSSRAVRRDPAATDDKLPARRRASTKVTTTCSRSPGTATTRRADGAARRQAPEPRRIRTSSVHRAAVPPRRASASRSP